MPQHPKSTGPNKGLYRKTNDREFGEAQNRLSNTRFRLGGGKTLTTKIPITRPRGRPSAVETIMLNQLIRNAAIMKGWLIVNNRVATGTAVDSINIKITRSKLARRAVSDRVNVGSVGSLDLVRLAKIASATDVGFVTGKIYGVPYLKFALQGRGAGTPPAKSDILDWMVAKGVGFSDSRYSLSQQAFFIAQKIGKSGTNPPHFTANIKTKMMRISTTKLVRNLAKIFPRYVGGRFADALVAVGKIMDNVEIRRVTPEQLEFEDFI